MRRYRLIPENASIPATINVIGNHILTSAMLKNTKEAMIKITPTATVKIPNCLGMNHLKKRRAHHTPMMGVQSSKDIHLAIGPDQVHRELDYRHCWFVFPCCHRFLGVFESAQLRL